MAPAPEVVTISKELANKILNYMASRPWLEVDELVCGLIGRPVIPPNAPAPAQAPVSEQVPA